MLRLNFVKWKRVDQDRFWVEGGRSGVVTKPGSRLFFAFTFQGFRTGAVGFSCNKGERVRAKLFKE